MNRFGCITFTQLDEQWRLRDDRHGEIYSLTLKNHTEFELYLRFTTDFHSALSFAWRLVASHLTAFTNEYKCDIVMTSKGKKMGIASRHLPLSNNNYHGMFFAITIIYFGLYS